MFKVLLISSCVLVSGCFTSGCAGGLSSKSVKETLQAMDEYDKQCAKKTTLVVMASAIIPPQFSLTVDKDCTGDKE